MPKKIYRLAVEPITCVHIGSGNELTLLDYTVLDIENGEHLYIKFSSDKILQRIAKDTQKLIEFERASMSGSMKDLQTFFQKNCSPINDMEYSCAVTNEFYTQYNRNIKKDPYDNAARVEQMYHPNGLEISVIPGSSLKGSIRTAILNKRMADLKDKFKDKYSNLLHKFETKKNDKERTRFESELQKELLDNYKDAKQDPFRGVEISDCAFTLKDTQIVGVLKTISAAKQKLNNSMQIQAEVLKGFLMDFPSKGESKLRLNTDVMNSLSLLLSIDDIIGSCNYFYKREFDLEHKKFYKDTAEHCYLISKLREEIEKICKTPNQFIVRVGRWSQVEFVTFEENFRSPRTREIKGRKLPYGTTRTVFNYDGQYLPFGWCKCTVEEV